MSFRPANQRRLRNIAPAAYSVVRNGKSISLIIRISKALQNSAGIKLGDAVRLDLGEGSDYGTIRLTPVGEGSRHWCKVQSGISLYTTISYESEIAAILPRVTRITALEVADISRTDGLTLQLPSTAQPSTTVNNRQLPLPTP